MARGSQWWARQVDALPEFGTAKMAGVVAAVLFCLCGLLVADFGALIPAGPTWLRAADAYFEPSRAMLFFTLTDS